MPYAKEGTISQSPLPGGVAISEEQYAAALDGILEGKLVTIAGGFAVVDPEPEVVEEPAPEPEAEPPLALCQIAAVRLVIDGFDITGFERSQGIGSAMMLDENTAWIFFEETQADTNYIVTPGDGVTKYAEYFEVLCPGVVTLALIVQRVQ